MLDFELEVMLVGLGTHLDFFYFNLDLFFTCFRCTFGLLVLVFTVIHNPANRRSRLGLHFHQIKTAALGQRQCFVKAQNSKLITLIINNPNLAGRDGIIYIGFLGDDPTPLSLYNGELTKQSSSRAFTYL